MPVYLLPEEPIFPPASEAEPDGLVAVGGDFSPERLLNAYMSGIFPWFEEDGDIYWFSPDPRMVLIPGDLRVSPSLERILKKGRFEIRFDHDFRGVMKACAESNRKDETGTWISDRFIEGYTRLHELGFAHSAEAWFDGELAGGLYGVAIGSVFFGESMFYRQPDASKAAFVMLVRRLSERGYRLIDCQTESEHMRRFGARPVSRDAFLKLIQEAVAVKPSSEIREVRKNV